VRRYVKVSVLPRPPQVPQDSPKYEPFRNSFFFTHTAQLSPAELELHVPVPEQ
jgi:hypothetical protein